MQTRSSLQRSQGVPDIANQISNQDAKLAKRNAAFDKSTQRKTDILEGLVCQQDPNGGNVIHYPGFIKAHVPQDIWESWHQPDPVPVEHAFFPVIHRGIPTYLIKFLRCNKGADMNVAINEIGGQTGRLFIIETISTPFEGAFFLVTPAGESELAVSVVGFDAYAFAGGRFMVRGIDEQHTQYISQMPNQMMENWVYSQVIPSDLQRSLKYGDLVQHSRVLGQAATSISCLVISSTFINAGKVEY